MFFRRGATRTATSAACATAAGDLGAGNSSTTDQGDESCAASPAAWPHRALNAAWAFVDAGSDPRLTSVYPVRGMGNKLKILYLNNRAHMRGRDMPRTYETFTQK